MPNNPRPTSINLAKLFGVVTKGLMGQRETLNQADTYNNDHGDNMVQIFEVITQAVKDKKGADPADQLAYASEILRGRKSGSAQVYANGLAQASQQFQGQPVTTDNAGKLLQALLGSGQVPSATPQAESGGDLLGSLLGGLTGTQPANQQTDPGLDVGDLLNAGMAFMDAKQSGVSNTEAIVNALISASPMGQSSHRSQSGAFVANTIMQVLGSMSRRKP